MLLNSQRKERQRRDKDRGELMAEGLHFGYQPKHASLPNPPSNLPEVPARVARETAGTTTSSSATSNENLGAHGGWTNITSRMRQLGLMVRLKEDQHQFLTLVGQPPARLTAEQVAWVLGCQPHDVPILVAARMLKPLGNPAPNGIKFFATAEIMEQTRDRSWLARVTNTVNHHWQKKNARQKKRNGSQDGHAPLLDLSASAPS